MHYYSIHSKWLERASIGEVLEGWPTAIGGELILCEVKGSGHDLASQAPLLRFVLDFNAAEWKRAWSINEFVQSADQLIRRYDQYDLLILDFDDWPEELTGRNAFGQWEAPDVPVLVLQATSYVPTANLEELVSTWGPRIIRLVDDVERHLAVRARENTIFATFAFPEVVRIPCEQYLLYFAQFLKDLGVDAQTELQHEAGQVLFSVTPADRKEALEAVRLALGVYLQLPNVEQGNPSDLTLELQSLLANVHHLKGQLYLAAAALQHKDASIGQLNATIEMQRIILSGDLFGQSLKALSTGAAEKSAEDSVEIAGLIEITKYEGKGFRLNLPEIYRRLKRWMLEDDLSDSAGDNPSALG